MNDLETINLQNLPSKGLFYPEEFEIYIRGALKFEVEKYESADFSNYYSTHQEILHIISSCVVVSGGKHKGSINQIKEIDKMWILLRIRELTEDQTPIFLPLKGKPFTHVELSTNNLDLWDIHPKLMEKYSFESKCFHFESKWGDYYIGPPSIGIYMSFFEYLKNKIISKKAYDVEYMNTAPYLNTNKTFISIDEIEDLKEKFDSLETEEYVFFKQHVDIVSKNFGIRRLKNYIEEENQNYYAEFDIFKNSHKMFNKIGWDK